MKLRFMSFRVETGMVVIKKLTDFQKPNALMIRALNTAQAGRYGISRSDTNLHSFDRIISGSDEVDDCLT